MTEVTGPRYSQAPFLEAEEERELARRAGAGDKDAANRLVASHLNFVVKIARSYRRSGVPMSDLIQEGMVGLVKAIKRFNPEKDARLATYAMWSIRASMQDHVVRSWSLVRFSTSSAQKSLFLQLRRMTSEFLEGADALGEDFAAKLAGRFETKAADVISIARRIANRDLSLNIPINKDDTNSESWLEQLPSDQTNAEDKLVAEGEHKALGDLLARALAKLPDREQFIIRGRYFTEAKQTFASLGRDLNLSKDRVRQLEARGLAKLKELLGPRVSRGRVATD
ncbi:MAG: RNA polymerase factor sigma-32 [Rhodospirillales bacterium]|nr:RNA polymerase factor sigma-32 [Rhodospirillales bacterium]